MSKFLSDYTSPLTLAGISDLTTGLPVIATSSSSIGTGLLSISDTTNLTTQLANKDRLDFTQQTGAVDAPSLGSVRVFAKADKNLYVKNDAGEETRIGINYAGLSESGQVLFLNKSVSNDFGYNTLSTSLTSTGEVSTDYIITGASQLLDSFITDANFPNITELKQGLSRLTLFCSVDAVDGSTTISFDVYIRSSAGSEVWLFSSDNSIDITNTASPEDISLDLAIQNTNFDPTDRIIVKLYGSKTSAGSRTLTVKYEGNSNYSNWRSTLNGLESVSAKTQNQYATPAITDFVGTVAAKSDFTPYLDYDIDTVLSSTIAVSPDGRSASFTSVDPQTPFVTYPVSNISSQRLEMALDKTGSAIGGLKELRIFFGSLYNSSSNKFVYDFLTEVVTIFDGATSSTLPSANLSRIAITYDGVTMELRDPATDTILLQHSTPTAGGSSLIAIMAAGADIGYSDLDILEYGIIDSATLEPTGLSFKAIPGVTYNGLQMSDATTLSLQSQNLTLDASDYITATAPVVTNDKMYANQLKVSDDIAGYLTAEVQDAFLSTVTLEGDKRCAQFSTVTGESPHVNYTIGGADLITTVKMDIDTIGTNVDGERYLEIYFGSYLQISGNRLKYDFVAGTVGIYDGVSYTSIAAPSTTRLVVKYDRFLKTMDLLDPIDETTTLLSVANPEALGVEELDIVFKGIDVGYSNIEIDDIGDVNTVTVSSTGIEFKAIPSTPFSGLQMSDATTLSLESQDLSLGAQGTISVNAPVLTDQTNFTSTHLVPRSYADTKTALGKIIYSIRGSILYNNGEPLPPILSGSQPTPVIIDDTPVLQYTASSAAKSGLVTDDYNSSRVILDYLDYVYTAFMMRYAIDDEVETIVVRILPTTVTFTVGGPIVLTLASSVPLEGSHTTEIHSFYANSIRYISLIVDGRVEDTKVNPIDEATYKGYIIFSGNNFNAREILALDTSNEVLNEPILSNSLALVSRTAKDYTDNKYDQSLNTTDPVIFSQVDVGDLQIINQGVADGAISCQNIEIIAQDLTLTVANGTTMSKIQTLANVTNSLEVVSKNYITANNTDRNPLYYHGYMSSENTTVTSTQTVINTFKDVNVPSGTFTVAVNNTMFSTTTTSNVLQLTYVTTKAPKYVHITFQCLVDQSQATYTARYGIAVNNVMVPSSLTYLKCAETPVSRNFTVQGIALMLNTNDTIRLQWAVDNAVVNRTTTLERCNVVITTM